MRALANGESASPQQLGGASAPPSDGRASWPELPRRTAPRRAPSLLAIRTPISRRAAWALGGLSMLLLTAAWTLLSSTDLVTIGETRPGDKPTKAVPDPWSVWLAGKEMVTSGQMFGFDPLGDFWITTLRIGEGFGLAVLVSVPLGIIMGAFASGNAFFEPPIAMVRYLPATAFQFPLMVWLGIEEGPKIGLLFLGTVFFNTLMTADVVRNVPGVLVDVSYTLGARRSEVLWKVIVPHALPGMIDAIRVNLAAAWNFVVVAELVAATAGLGYRMNKAARTLDLPSIFAILVVIGLTGVLLDTSLRLLRQRLGRWVV